uniref:Uncharacterized protein n=1 Tax=Peronospora matthiolae TaxID=2874970 RepID=A0AAV1URR5_9STRA
MRMDGDLFNFDYTGAGTVAEVFAGGPEDVLDGVGSRCRSLPSFESRYRCRLHFHHQRYLQPDAVSAVSAQYNRRCFGSRERRGALSG